MIWSVQTSEEALGAAVSADGWLCIVDEEGIAWTAACAAFVAISTADHSTLFDTIDSMLTNFVSSYARHCVEIVYKISVRVLLVEEL